MTLTLVTAPALEPITREEAKAHLRVSLTDEDDLIDTLIQAAREAVEAETKRSLITTAWSLRRDAFPSGNWMLMPRPPLLAISAITYTDSAGSAQTLASTVYTVDTPAGPFAEPGRLALKYGQVYPSTYAQINSVAIAFTAGYGATAASVPAPLRQATLLALGHYYAHREAVVVGTIASALPMAFAALCAPYDASAFGMAA